MAARRSRPVAQYIALGVVFVLVVAFQIRSSFNIDPPPVSIPFGLQTGTSTIRWVTPESAKAGLRADSELLALNGEEYRGARIFSRVAKDARPGDTLRVLVRYGEAAQEIALQWGAAPIPISSGQQWLISRTLYLVMPWFCLLLGFWVVAVRPRDPQAWLLLLLMLTFPHLATRDRLHWEDGWRQFGVVYQAIIRSLLPVAMLLFGLYFIVRFPLDRRLPWLKWLILAPSLFFCALNPIVSWQFSETVQTGSLALWLAEKTGIVQGAIIMSCIGLFFAMTGWKMGVTPPGDARRRLLLLLWGTQIALAPMFLVVIAVLMTNRMPWDFMPAWIMTVALLMLFLFPLTLAYVIVVHRALDVRVVLRQGVQYALARGGVRALVVILAVVILYAASSTAFNPSGSRPGQILTIAIGVALMFLVLRLGKGAARWIDRRFFREAYDAEQILTDLSEEVRTIVDTPRLLETVARRISESLYVPHVAFLMPDGDGFRPAYAIGYGEPLEVSLPPDSATARHLAAVKEPAQVYLDDEKSWVWESEAMTDAERAKLTRLRSRLMLPLEAKDEVIGILSLGEKKSEEPYSGSDVRLLRSVASQAGLALENSRLTAAVAHEAAQRERINRELEIARGVQERLFPQQLPQIEGYDFAGYCRPALGVGGDYYDFMRLDDGRLGIAIGDVSGKGIAAALLMASLQASVRGQTLHPEQVAGIITLVNKLLYESSASSRYATLFYAQLEPASRTLVYVNAGHNPPMLLRNGVVQQLTTGGMVVGLLPRSCYQQDSVQLERGDVLLCFTDGISEAMNPADEEWGEAALEQAAHQCAGMTAREMIDVIVREADVFIAGARQHDDMTLVVLRVL